MDKPIFSIATASRRNQYYKWFYGTVAQDTDVPFEIVFVGPNPPLEPMPDNFKHIYSTATPCQCTEIAIRNAVGEYVLSIGDDHEFSNGFLDKLYGYTQKLDTDKTLISFRFQLRSPAAQWYGDNGLVFSGDIPTSPVVGIGPTFRKDIWMKLGGLDKRFHSTLCDLDMQMRFYEYGMRPFITPDCSLVEVWKGDGPFKEKGWNVPTHHNCSLLLNHYAPAQKLLNSLWVKDGAMSKTRLAPVERFTEKELQT